MKRFKVLQAAAAAVACIGMAIPTAAFAGTPVSRAPDVALQEGGLLVGQVLDAQGAPRAGAPVAIHQEGIEIARAVSDVEGRFAFSGVRGGVYHLVTTDGQAMYRAWADGTAPPAAQPAALIVGGDVVRGQCGTCNVDPCGCGAGAFGGAMGFLSNPWILAAIVATAIAVPIAVHDNNDGS